MDYQKPVRDQRSLWQQHPLICVCTIHRRQTTLHIIVYADRKKMSVTRAVQKSWEKIHADKRLQFNRSITVAAITDLTDSPGFQIFILKRENLTLNVDNKETTAVMSSWCFCILLFFCSSLFIFNNFSMKEKTVLFPKIFEFIHTVVFVIVLFFKDSTCERLFRGSVHLFDIRVRNVEIHLMKSTSCTLSRSRFCYSCRRNDLIQLLFLADRLGQTDSWINKL